MNFKDFMNLTEVAQIGFQDVEKMRLIGPFYHGTTEDKLNSILKSGFKVFVGKTREGDIRHGYSLQEYAQGKPAPVHHLGYGIYLTQNLSIAKQYQGSGKNIKTFYINAPR